MAALVEAPSVIYAKSRQQGRLVSLAEHTRAVLAAVERIFGRLDEATPLGERWLRFFGLAGDEYPVFWANLWLSAAFHDLGKANDGFQRMVQRRGDQAIRHEHLSGLLVWSEPLQGWLRELASRGVDAEIVAAAVVSHHLKVNDEQFAARQVLGERLAVQVYADSQDVRDVLTLAAGPFRASPPSLAALAGRWDFDPRIDDEQERFRGAMHRFGRAAARDERRGRLLRAVKAAVITADSAGSGIPRTGGDLNEWLDEVFGQPPLSAAEIDESVIQPRIEQLTRAGRWTDFHDFQRAAAGLGPRALLLAGCGAGKTLAAWLWIANQAEARRASRAIFLYPTRGTATEGFRDYVAWAGPERGALLHGTARFDLEGLFENGGDPRRDGDYTVPERLFALGYWPKRVFSATVDSFLAFVNNRYAALCLLPLLADSVVVIDEVHSFDRSMFRSLVSTSAISGPCGGSRN